MSIISSESRPVFEMRLRQQEALVICSNNMLSDGLDCQTQSTGLETKHRQIKDGKIVKEYALNVPRRSDVEGLEFVPAKDSGTERHHLLFSTGGFGGSLDVLELSANSEEWVMKGHTQV